MFKKHHLPMFVVDDVSCRPSQVKPRTIKLDWWSNG